VEGGRVTPRVREHLRANVVGYVALFFALGLGSAWAATELGKNEVRSRHLRNAGVKAKDLAADAVTSPKVADGALLGADFAPGELPRGPQGEPGPPGETGPPGARGPRGERGPSGTANMVARPSTSFIAMCAPGEVATGGGAVALGDDLLERSVPYLDSANVPVGWEANANETPGTGGDGVANGARAYVICASP
jgi:hypothetical protein